MTNPKSARPRFTFHGPIRIWDLAERRFSLGGRELWLAPNVPTGDLDLGTEVVASGYTATPEERWVVDLITVTSVVDRRPILLRRPRLRN